MIRYVVDTNVSVVANDRNTTASIDCRKAATDFLYLLIEKGQIALDIGGKIQAEYHRHLHPEGQPGVGNYFCRMVLNSAPGSVLRIGLRIDKLGGEFIDFPNDPRLDDFDKSDRKFPAIARKVKVPVANATDSDWHTHKLALRENGIMVKFVCGCDPDDWKMEA